MRTVFADLGRFLARRKQYWLVPLVVVLAPLTCLAVLARRSPRDTALGVFANASAYRRPARAPERFSPVKAVDGIRRTYWLLPKGPGGWLDVRFAAPRSLRRARLLNANYHRDEMRATKAFRIEAWVGHRRVAVARGAFARYEDRPAWRRVAIAAEGVTRVRFVVESWFGASGGLSEIDFE